MSPRRHETVATARRSRQPARSRPIHERARRLHLEVLEERRLLAVAGATSNDHPFAPLFTFGTGLSTSPPSSFIAPNLVVDIPSVEQVGVELSGATGPSSEAISYVLTALDDYVSAPDPNFSFTLANTFVGPGYDGYVLKLTSQEWRTADEVDRTIWEHWLIVSVPQSLNPDIHTALLAITGGNNNNTTPPSNFSIPELGFLSLLTGTVVAELRMVPNQPLTFAEDGENAATFFVPGEPNEAAELTFRFDAAPGSFQASFGFFDVSSVSADPVLAPRDYAVEAISNGTIAFDERVDATGTTFTVSVSTATELGFFIIPSNSAANFLADPDAYYGPLASRRAPLFSVPEANPGQLDQMVARIHDGVTHLGFEDISRIPGGGSDQNFTDVQISVEAELAPALLPSGSDYFAPGRTEDAIIAYSFDQFLTTGDETWPALLPMVKSAVRAMDAVQQYIPTIAPGAQVDDFVVTGGSKRGWTTWLTAAVDAASASPRVKAIIPMVFDVLNIDAQLDHHQEYYEGVTNSIIDGYSNALQDYTALDIFDRRDTPEGAALLSIIDPYAYLDRLTMPKFMINSTGDEFFVPDSGQYYLGDLPGQNYVRYVPNTNHDVLNNSDAAESLLAYYNAVVNDLPLPQFSWTVEDSGTTIRVETIDAPLQVNLWQATNYDSRDFRGSVTGIPWTSSPLVDQGGGVYVAQFSQPNLGATAFFVELVYPGDLYDFKFTTQVSVLAAEVQTPIEPWLVPQLVDDVNKATRSSDVSNLTEVNGTLFFTVYDTTYGRELWKSDGTAAGTILVADIFPGQASSYPNNLTDVNGTLFFTARDDDHGNELWKSDGTAAGTMLVADIRPGSRYGGYPYGSNPDYLTEVNGTLFFTAYDDDHGRELWKSDGTAAGTMLVADIRADSPYGNPLSSYPGNLTEVNGTLFFTAFDDDHGRELWKSDGNAAGTMLVADIRADSPYGYPRSSYPSNLTEVNGTLFFTARDDDHGNELWKSDGTAAGTMLVADIRPGSPYGYPYGSNPGNLTEVNGTLFFTAYDDDHGRELWKSDGTAAGTMLVADIRADSPYGYPRSSYPDNLTEINGTLFFTARDDDHGNELWKSDGTAEGTLLVADVRPGSPYGYPRSSYPGNLTEVNGTLYFTAYDDDHGNELWKSDGTAEGTLLVADIRAGSPYGYPRSSDPFNLVEVNGTLFFTAYDEDHGRELWKSDGQTDGTLLVKDIRHDTISSYPFSFTDVDGTLFFLVNNNDAQRVELWKSDGTATGAELVADYWSQSAIDQLTSVGGTLFFTANDNQYGRELWKSDGTAEGTQLVVDLLPGSAYGYPLSSNPYNLTAVNGTLYFTAYDDDHGNELWKSDGTAEGTLLVADILAGSPYGYPRSSYPYNLTVVNGTLFFSAYDDEHGRELWKSDGTIEGTMFVADIRPGSPNGYPRSSYPGNLTEVGDKLFFTAFDDEHGNELWTSDGTTEGTVLVTDIRPNSPYGYPRSSYPTLLTGVDGMLFFTAHSDEYGRELWKSDGTAEGTMLAADIYSGGGGAYPSQLTASHGTLFFTVYDGSLGRELWKSDGTQQGTVPVKNIRSGPGSSYPYQLTDVNGLLFFVANDGEHGAELWQSDGSTGGTVMVADIRPGGVSSYPSQLTNVGGTLFFAANGPQTGNEPWLLVQPVEIDVRPHSEANKINLKSNGKVPAAIFGSESLDVSIIDQLTLTLAGAAVTIKKNGTPMFQLQDINSDGQMDLLVKFAAKDLQLSGSDTTVALEGKLVNGQRIIGIAAVQVVEPKHNGQGGNQGKDQHDDKGGKHDDKGGKQDDKGGKQDDKKGGKGAIQAHNDHVEAELPTAQIVSRPLDPSAVDTAIGMLTGIAKSRRSSSHIASLLDDGGPEELLLGVVDSHSDDRVVEELASGGPRSKQSGK